MMHNPSAFRLINQFTVHGAVPGSWQAQMCRRAVSANSLDDVIRAPSFLKLQH